MNPRYIAVFDAALVAIRDKKPTNAKEAASYLGTMVGEYFKTGDEALAFIDAMLEAMNMHALAASIRKSQR